MEMSPNLPLIYGFNKASEIGPDVLAPCIFIKGCNLRCPYCMNSKLVKNCKLEPIALEIVKDYVLTEKSKWVLISGGEPTLTDINSLVALINEIKSWGCKVGMSTNGTKPQILEKLLTFIDYVALDIKCVSEIDSEEIMDRGYIFQVLTSQVKLMEAKRDIENFDYEIRTTLYPPFINKTAINAIGSLLKNDTRWVLQQFRHAQDMLSETAYQVKPYTDKEVNELLEIAKQYSCNVAVRYV